MKRPFTKLQVTKSPFTKALAAGLALSLLASTAASAAPWDHRSHGSSGRGDWHGHDHGGRAVVALGAGLLALGVIGAIASSNAHEAPPPPRYYGPPPPPPGYDRHNGYDDRYGGYGY